MLVPVPLTQNPETGVPEQATYLLGLPSQEKTVEERFQAESARESLRPYPTGEPRNVDYTSKWISA